MGLTEGDHVVSVLVARSDANSMVADAAVAQLIAAGHAVVELEDVPPGRLDAALLACDPGDVGPALERALEAGDDVRVVLLSSASAPYERLSPEHERWFLPAEELVEQSADRWVVVRPVGPMSAALAWAEQVRRDSVVRHPFGSAAYPHVHEADVAAVLVACALDGAQDGQRLVVTGPQAVTPVEQTASLAAAVGRPLEFVELTPEEARTRWRAAGWADDAIDLELALLADAAERPPATRDTIQRVTGQPGRSFDRWARDHADRFR